MSFKQLTTIICFLLITASLSAQVPNTINYQGRLTDASGSPVADNAYLVKFIIYDAPTAGTDLWNTGFQTINTVDGLFTYKLGSNIALPSGIFSDTNRYLGITVGTDPELSPRTRFSPSSYAFNAATADNVVWSHISSMPAGFADGVDDEGLSQANADADYVNVTGDDMTGDLQGRDLNGTARVKVSGSDGGIKTYGENGNLMSRLWSYSYGELTLRDTDGISKVDLGAGSGSGFLYLYGSNGIYLNTSNSGNTSVSLPNDAISNSEILDEPGIAQGIKTASTYLPNYVAGNTMMDMVTTSITIPAPGYIFLTSKCYLYNSGTTGANITEIQIDEETGGIEESPYFNSVGNNGYYSTASHRFSVFLSRTYYKSSAGTYTFRLEAEKVTTAGSSYIWNPVITAIYIPTSYGTVSTVASDPNGDSDAKLVSITDEDGNTHTGYEIDLRNLELKAKAAQLKAKEAELELMKAQQRQNRQEE